MSFSFTDLQIAEQEQDEQDGANLVNTPWAGVVDNNPHSSLVTWSVITFFVVGVYLMMILFCLVVNTVFGTVLFCMVKTTKSTFYRLVWQLILANIFSALSNCFTILPTTFMSKAESDKFLASSTYAVFNWFDLLGDQIILLVTLLIAIHRVFIFVFPYLAEKYFKGKNLNILIGICWIIGVSIASFNVIFGCAYKYNVLMSMYDYICTNIKYKFTVKTIELAFLLEIIFFPLATFFCYLFVLYKVIRMKSQGIRLNSAELEVLKQATVLFIVFGFSTIVTSVSMYLPIKEVNTFLVARMINTFELLAGTTTPLLFFFTSIDIKEGLSRLQMCRLGSTLSLLSSKVSSIKPSNPPTPPIFLSPRQTHSVA